ncbi:RagB/SusD family nutrient uptake outer membrane protein [Segetibacter sp. 3557_3]|uniref:RagB/SusD family nutrient uptake outer membrane protein n=1 Tax=Segetibacter sp. 3557_3 TaxID=2547429 RepID=UPI001058E139|nr:RagB/SusD family nutrient uptake outer membrane protein [Segetibacter sp. 3557_3]TDH28534.1 RagB/SusD family nutrient uptake outer membrane protein [Segetibacter sp. 3557_3]
MKNRSGYAWVLVAVLAIATSCQKYLDRTPLSAVTQRDFYSNADQVQQALTGVYNAIGARTMSPGFSNPTTYYSKFDLYTELGIERALSGTIGSGSYDVTNGTVAELWAGFFQVVQRANNLLFYMTKAESVMTPADYKRVVAEAKVLRAMAYWHLIALYGDVPYFTAPPASPEEIYNFSRTPKSTIIAALIPELEAAAADLDWLPAQAGRVSKGVAMGIGARLAMLDKNYTYAANITDNIIANSPYGLNPVYQNLFRLAGQKSNAANEIMFWYPFGDADAGSYNYIQLVQGSRNNGGQSSHFPTQFLVDLFECTDGRNIASSPLYNPARPNQNRDPRMGQTVFVPGDTMVVQGFTSIIFNFYDRFLASYNPTTRAITFPSTTVNQDSANIFGPRLNGLGNLWKKYSQDRDINGTAGNLYRVGWIYMRYAEILLINAEAHLEKGDPATTIVPSLNRVRARAGMPNVAADVVGDANRLKQLVRREKMVELANEGLHLPDMRRWDNGAYAQKVLPGQLYGQANSPMRFVPNVGLEFINPAPPPVFDPVYQVPVSWPNGDALRLKREVRIYNPNQHSLLPVPQGERDKVPALTQNPGW